MTTELEPADLSKSICLGLATDHTLRKAVGPNQEFIEIGELERLTAVTVERTELRIWSKNGVLYDSTDSAAQENPARFLATMLLFQGVKDNATEMRLELTSDNPKLYMTIQEQEYEMVAPPAALAKEMGDELVKIFDGTSEPNVENLALRLSAAWRVFEREGGEPASYETSRNLEQVRTSLPDGGIRFVVRFKA